MAHLYADENFDHPVVAHLRTLGHDVLTAQQAGQANQSIADPLVLAFATGQGRAVLTFNYRHFVRLHKQTVPTGSHSGILVCKKDDDLVALALRIHQAIAALPSLVNQLVRIRKPAVSSPPSPRPELMREHGQGQEWTLSRSRQRVPTAARRGKSKVPATSKEMNFLLDRDESQNQDSKME